MEKKASPIEVRMTQPTLKPTAHNQMLERRHSDPPVLWVSVILGSVVIHIFAFWIVRLLLMGRLPSLQTAFIPVDVIAVASETALSTQRSQIPGSTATRTPTSVETPIRRTSNRPVRPTSPTTPLNRTNPQQTRIPAGQSASTPNSSQNQQPNKPTGQSVSTPNSSPNQQPDTPTGQNPPAPSQNQPNTPTGQNPPAPSQNQPDTPTGQNPPAPSQTQQPDTPTGQNTPESQSGGDFVVSVSNSGFRRSVSGTDIPSQEAKVKNETRQFTAADYGAQLGGNLEQDVVLEVLLLIDNTGKATLQSPPQVVQGSSNVDPTKLAQLVIQGLQFEPAYMDGGAVAQEYYVRLQISPLAN